MTRNLSFPTHENPTIRDLAPTVGSSVPEVQLFSPIMVSLCPHRICLYEALSCRFPSGDSSRSTGMDIGFFWSDGETQRRRWRQGSEPRMSPPPGSSFPCDGVTVEEWCNGRLKEDSVLKDDAQKKVGMHEALSCRFPSGDSPRLTGMDTSFFWSDALPTTACDFGETSPPPGSSFPCDDEMVKEWCNGRRKEDSVFKDDARQKVDMHEALSCRFPSGDSSRSTGMDTGFFWSDGETQRRRWRQGSEPRMSPPPGSSFPCDGVTVEEWCNGRLKEDSVLKDDAQQKVDMHEALSCRFPSGDSPRLTGMDTSFFWSDGETQRRWWRRGSAFRTKGLVGSDFPLSRYTAEPSLQRHVTSVRRLHHLDLPSPATMRWLRRGVTGDGKKIRCSKTTHGKRFDVGVVNRRRACCGDSAAKTYMPAPAQSIMCNNIENIADPSLPMMPPPMNFLDEQRHLCEIHFSELRAGGCRQRVATRLPRFWKAQNVKKGGKLMGVDLLLLDRKVTVQFDSGYNQCPSAQNFQDGWLYDPNVFDAKMINQSLRLSDSLALPLLSVYSGDAFSKVFSITALVFIIGRFHHSSLVLRCASAASSSSNATTAEAPKPSGCKIRAASSSNSMSDREAILSIRLKKMIHLQVEELRGQGVEHYAYKWEKATVQIGSKRSIGMQSLHLEDAVGEQKDDDDSYEVTLDEDFLTALEYVMPPTASGMAGDAVDKLCEYKRRHCVSCSEGSAVIIAPNVSSIMFQSSGIKPNIRTFNILLDSYGKRGNYKKMSAVMKFVDLVTYNVVIDAFERGYLKQMEIPI
ncbi:hypothetical protein HID58_014877 [Brassica napus]|uniref:Uncharacterized protein n=1 Tax=Brassica napus TaxID=3708 RepID=A0ABQ8DIE4_BRANA|nr:hypothetical protein HID58_014877 [Brassica napus]